MNNNQLPRGSRIFVDGQYQDVKIDGLARVFWPTRDSAVLAYQGMCEMLINNGASTSVVYKRKEDKAEALERYLDLPKAYLETMRKYEFSRQQIDKFEKLIEKAGLRFERFKQSKANKLAQRKIEEMTA